MPLKNKNRLSAVLEGNPYTFTPPQEKQAAFNAKIKISLKLPASQYLAPTLDYLQGSDYSQWQNRGPARVGRCSRALAAAKNVKKPFSKRLPGVLVSVLISLCQCLENEAVDAAIAEILLQRLQQALSAPAINSENSAAVAACLRGLSFSVSATHIQTAVDSVLHGGTSGAAIDIVNNRDPRHSPCPTATRWRQPTVFMELLAQHNEQAFIGVMSELLYQPAIREPFISAMRPSRSLRIIIKGNRCAPSAQPRSALATRLRAFNSESLTKAIDHCLSAQPRCTLVHLLRAPVSSCSPGM